MTRLIEALAEFDDRIAPGWPGAGYRAARTLVQAIAAAVLLLLVFWLITVYGAALGPQA